MNTPNNFGAIDSSYDAYDYDAYEKAKVVILPVPYEGTVTYGKGASRGPQAIIEASKNMELFEDGKNIFKIGIHTLPELYVKNIEPRDVLERMFRKAREILNDKKFIVVLGGEHSITQASVKACKEKFSDISLLQIDAHSDLREEYEFSKFSHACVMKRIYEMNIPIVQVGIRSTSEEEKEIFNKNKENIFLADDIINAGGDKWIGDVLSKLSKNVFVSIDVDAFDTGIMPSTGAPEPGGLQWHHIIKLLKKLAADKNVVGFDVVELAPIQNLHAPDFLCAKLVYKFLGYIFKK